MKTKILITTIALSGLGLAAQATVLNFDPNSVTPSESDYTQVTTPQPGGPGGQWVEGTWAITTNPQLEHGYWYSFTAPEGQNMMTVNGATTAGDKYWDVTIGSGITTFNVLVANNYPDSPADLVLLNNGTQVGSDFSAPNPPGTWTEWTVNAPFDAGTLAIVDNNLVSGGNDFALTNVPDGGLTAGLLGGALIGIGALRRKLSI